MEDILILLFLIIATAITRPHIQKRFQYVPLAIIFIILLDSCKAYIELTLLQFRLYNLFEIALIIAGLIYFIVPYRKTRQYMQSKLDSIILYLTQFLFLFTGISLVSNILGYSNLSIYMLKIVTQSLDATFIFYALMLVVNSLVLGLIHRRSSSSPLFKQTNRIALEIKVLRLINFAIFLLWLYYFLITADLYEPLADFLSGFLTQPYRVGSITFTIGMMLTFIFILVGSFLITSIISFFLDGNEVQLEFIKLPKGVPAAVSLVIRYFILTVGFVLAISSLGIELSEFNLLAGALGLGIGFGLQTVVSNFISGIILVFERPILPGDVVEVNNLLGTVNKIGVRASRINTFDGSEVVVPNNSLISNDLINWTLSNNTRRLEILVGTSYDADPNVVLEALKEVANSNDFVLKNPAPLALFVEFGESSLNFRLLIWINIQNVLAARSEVSVAIYNRFKELGIKIPYPQRVVHLPDKEDTRESG